MSPPVSPPPPPQARLNGWKEIAAHFGKGVRTLQRWEKELGLPVHRLGGSGRGEVVFALVAELDGWRQALERRDPREPPRAEGGPPVEGLPGAPVEETGPSSPSGPETVDVGTASAARGRRRMAVTSIGLVLLGLVAAGTWWLFLGQAPQPNEARVENRLLRVYDEQGRVLWTHRFDAPLTDTPRAQANRSREPSTFVEDLDGDGSREVVFIGNQEPYAETQGIVCFDARGRVRWQHRTARQGISFGGVPVTGPLHPLQAVVTPEPDGRKSIWVASNDRNQFPTVLEKLDHQGRLRGEYWSAGLIMTLLPTTLDGRAVLLVGACRNESLGASLAVLDVANPTGTSPARRERYVCRGCPPGEPLAFLVFPPTLLERLEDNTSAVRTIWRGSEGQISLTLEHPAPRIVGDAAIWTLYQLDAGLRPLAGERQPSYIAAHNALHRHGLIGHPYGQADQDSVWPLLRWDGSDFEPVRP